MIRKLLLILTVICCHYLKGQKEGQPYLVVKTHVYNDGVAIRWTPSDINTWRRWGRKGYRLERFRLGVNDQPAGDTSGLLIGGDAILPFVREEWGKLIQDIPTAGLVKHCLMLDTNVLQKDKNGLLQAYHEDESAYVLAMLTMQSDFRLAMAGGIGLVDNSAKGDEVYLYRLFPVDAPELAIRFVVDMRDIKVLPIMDTLRLRSKENRILLEWNALKYRDDYYAFMIERSIDSGKSFYPMNTIPLIPVTTEDAEIGGAMLYFDSVVKYGEMVFYRIKGISYFGQRGEPSQAVGIRVFQETDAFPKFLELVKSDRDSTWIEWQFEEAEEKNIKGFNVLWAPDPQSEFMPLDSVLLEADSRNVKLYCNKSVMYIKIAAITHNGHLNVSFPLMLQRPDSIAPIPPKMIDLITDSSGLAKLHWKANTEEDLLGYMVFRGNSRSQEFTCITSDYLADSFFQDSLYTEMIRDSIYYKVMAFDQHFNASGYSHVIAAPLRDRIPPAPPVIFDFKAGSKQVVLKWHSSNSRDVKACHLFRQHVQTGENTHLVLTPAINEFKDSLVEQGSTYRYSMKAEDFAGHLSVSARPTEVHVPLEKLMPEVIIKDVYNDTLKNYVTVYWEYMHDHEVSHYRIVQVMPDGTSRTVGTSEAGNKFHTFYYMKPYITTTYYIIAYFKDGRRSKI